MTHLGSLTWPEAERTGATLVIPLGSTEQHGPHLPLDTDTRIAVALAERAASGSDAVVAPPLAYGSSGEHQGFAGTLSIGTDALRAVIVELCRSARSSFGRVVLVNGHGGNQAAVAAAVDQLRHEGHDVRSWSPLVAGADAHAGRTETSLLLYLWPDVVDMASAVVGTTRPLPELIEDLRRDGVRPHAPSGVLGDPMGASAEIGEALFAEAVESLSRLLRGG